MTKRVIITGASSGIGWHTALLLADRHFELVLAARREDKLRELAELCRDRGAIRADVFAADLSIGDNGRALAQNATEDGFQPPLVLVNNAGIAEFGDYHSMSPESIDRHLASNLLGPMHLTHALIPHMLEMGGGQIVNVLSIASIHVFAGSSAYSASKAGMLMFSKTLAASYRDQGIRVSAVIPGSVDTPLWEGKGWIPEREDMLQPAAVAECIRDIIESPPDRNYDEVLLMPPKGIL